MSWFTNFTLKTSEKESNQDEIDKLNHIIIDLQSKIRKNKKQMSRERSHSLMFNKHVMELFEYLDRQNAQKALLRPLIYEERNRIGRIYSQLLQVQKKYESSFNQLDQE